jgi:hypothetical protein
MARSSLANSSSKLNVSRRQTALFQKIILAGNHMAKELNHLNEQSLLPKRTKKLARRWGGLMVELVEMLF